MRVVLCGSRDIEDYETVCEVRNSSPFEATKIVCGDAPGVDELAQRWARFTDDVELSDGSPHEADWDNTDHPDAVVRTRSDGAKYDASAGPRRNRKMVEEADAFEAIWDGQSPGTKSTIKEGYELGMPGHVHLTPDPPENDMSKEELLRRFPEIELIDGFVQTYVIDAFCNHAPEYFWEVPTSSTGKYHPEDERGEHGNWLHTKRVFYQYDLHSESLLRGGVITETQRNRGRAAALLHDLFKYGYPEREGEHTVNYHDILNASFVRQHTELDDEVARIIETHNGPWHLGPFPRTLHEWAHHFADQSAAHSYNATACYGPVADELHEISDSITEVDIDE